MDINAATSNAGSVKAVLDVPILTEDGALTEASGEITEKIGSCCISDPQAFENVLCQGIIPKAPQDSDSFFEV